MSRINLFADIPENLNSEVFQSLLQGDNLKIERIVSKGHTSPAKGWYQQEQHEWVSVLKGEARLLFEDGREVHLLSGDHINIPAQCRHKVAWTLPESETIWLAVHYS